MGRTERSRAKKWIVEEVIVREHAVVVPLRIDPETGEFWFEYPLPDEAQSRPKAVQHSAPTRAGAKAMISDAVTKHADLDWQPFIAVALIETARGWDRLPPQVGFEQLLRLERAQHEVVMPPRYGNHRQEAEATKRVMRGESMSMDTPKVVTLYRPFQEEDPPLLFSPGHVGDRMLVRPNRRAKLLPYSEELWQSLVAIFEEVQRMNGRLADLLKGDHAEVAERLATVLPSRMLLGPSEEPC